jgi:phosphatidylglycerol---prolipoprotein diacylglyceryl transferase
MLVYPHIDPVIFSVGPLKIRWYGLMYVIGFLAAWWLAKGRAKKPWSVVSPAQVDDLIFYAMLGVILGGRIGSVFVYNFDLVLDDPLYPLKIWEGGMSFHGGLVGVIVAMWFFARKCGRGLWQINDFVAPLAPLGLGFGRIGNFINGELWGKQTDVPWGMLVDGRVLHPSQLYESALEGFALFAILWWFSSKPRPTMAVSGLFLACYGAFRFLIEFVRVPDANLGYLALDWVTMGQVLSAPMIVAGVTMLILAYRSIGKEATA